MNAACRVASGHVMKKEERRLCIATSLDFLKVANRVFPRYLRERAKTVPSRLAIRGRDRPPSASRRCSETNQPGSHGYGHRFEHEVGCDFP